MFSSITEWMELHPSIASGRTVGDFKTGKIKFLVSTGIAARGIDIGELSRVVNYDLPDQSDDYIHRIGRTGRAGASGEAISFVAKDNFRNLCIDMALLILLRCY